VFFALKEKIPFGAIRRDFLLHTVALPNIISSLLPLNGGLFLKVSSPLRGGLAG